MRALSAVQRETFRTRTALLLALAASAAGCQQDMATQPSARPLQASTLFEDGRASRHLVSGTVARGRLKADAPYFTGRAAFRSETSGPANQENANGNAAAPGDEENAKANRVELFGRPDFVDEFPLPVDEEFVRHGRDRYMIYCVVCHDSLGTGRGKIVERGYTRPPSYHIDRLRDAPVGRLFAVATEGYGSMPSYGDQIPTRDRWAIVAYIRALQLSQHFPEDDLTDDMRRERTPQAAAAAQPGNAEGAP